MEGRYRGDYRNPHQVIKSDSARFRVTSFCVRGPRLDIDLTRGHNFA